MATPTQEPMTTLPAKADVAPAGTMLTLTPTTAVLGAAAAEAPPVTPDVLTEQPTGAGPQMPPFVAQIVWILAYLILFCAVVWLVFIVWAIWRDRHRRGAGQ